MSAPFPSPVSGLPTPAPASASLVYISELLTLLPLLRPPLEPPPEPRPTAETGLERSRSEPEDRPVLSTIFVKFHPDPDELSADVPAELLGGGFDHPLGLLKRPEPEPELRSTE